jgi:hypothetical protein
LISYAQGKVYLFLPFTLLHSYEIFAGQNKLEEQKQYTRSKKTINKKQIIIKQIKITSSLPPSSLTLRCGKKVKLFL